jgi:hypothetical protein
MFETKGGLMFSFINIIQFGQFIFRVCVFFIIPLFLEFKILSQALIWHNYNHKNNPKRPINE